VSVLFVLTDWAQSLHYASPAIVYGNSSLCFSSVLLFHLQVKLIM